MCNEQMDLTGRKQPAALCAFPKDVPGGGLTLGQIRELGDELIRDKDCKMCGSIKAGFKSKNVSDPGYLMFEWQDNASCRPPCIQQTDLSKANATDAKPVPKEEGKNMAHVIVPSMIWAGAGSMAAALLW